MCKEENVIQYGDGVIYRRRFLAFRTELVSNEKERNNKKEASGMEFHVQHFGRRIFVILNLSKILNFQEIWQKVKITNGKMFGRK